MGRNRFLADDRSRDSCSAEQPDHGMQSDTVHQNGKVGTLAGRVFRVVVAAADRGASVGVPGDGRYGDDRAVPAALLSAMIHPGPARSGISRGRRIEASTRRRRCDQRVTDLVETVGATTLVHRCTIAGSFRRLLNQTFG